jgi:phenylalanyl-tRNA synthetase beta chain
LVDENKEAMPRDSIFDIKVLPNRAHDALGHLGMAREWAAVLGLTFKNLNIPRTESDQSVSGVEVRVLDSKLCSRFMSARIDGVDIKESPEWLSDNLRRIGQKSINNIVDITNYVQFTLNKPMHAYGAENIDGGIVVRFAEEGETLETLDDRELKLNAKTLVIADNKKSLGLAGIKGGKHSGINPNTKSIIIESANFNPSLIRKTSLKYDLRTDASKRFENGIANSLVEDGFWMTVNEIKKLFPEAKLGPVTDFYPVEDRDRWVGVTKKEIGDFLGKDFSQEQIESALKALQFKFEKIIPANYIKDNMRSVIGVQYKNPSSMSVDAPNYFSCSSLVSYLYKGVWLPAFRLGRLWCQNLRL